MIKLDRGVSVTNSRHPGTLQATPQVEALRLTCRTWVDGEAYLPHVGGW